MSYQVMYRRFRPQNFAEIVGQEHIIKILKNQIITGNISHAYLFAGPRGTGKTSAAKVFARAVNCENPSDGESCGKCAACTVAERDALPDVMEIDAASNRGIDEIRQIKDKVNYLPSTGKYRVYIIDEVHMLTTEAFNALLKTLEEPPAHVIFIFATTEVQKILPTILSRCQRFDFTRIPESVIKDKLITVLNELGVDYEDAALEAICAAADGAMRDAFSITDKVINMSPSNKLTLSDVQSALGIGGEDDVLDIAKYIISGDASKAVSRLDRAIESGADIEYIVSSLTEYFRNLMIYSVTENSDKLLLKGDRYISSLKELSVGLQRDCSVAYLNVLSKIKPDSRFINMRYIAEAAIIKLCDIKSVTDTIALETRIERLEKRLDGLSRGVVPVKTIAEQPQIAPKEESENSETPLPKAQNTSVKSTPAAASDGDPTSKAAITEMKNLMTFAGNYINNSERDIMLQGFYFDMQPTYYDGRVIKMYLGGASANMMDVFNRHDGLKKLKTILAKRLGHEVEITITEAPEMSPENILSSAMEVFGNLEEIKE